jgi:nickel superoxide dismutase
MNRHLIAASTVIALVALSGSAFAHCQIPCGIFEDELRVQLMEEDITTIEKSMQEITSLSAKTPVNYNQLVRWVTNKEDHANKIMDLVADYFLSQRVKKPAEATGAEYQRYLTQLTVLHEITVTAMKSKQTTDLAHVAKLRELVGKFRLAYFGEEGGHSH